MLNASRMKKVKAYKYVCIWCFIAIDKAVTYKLRDARDLLAKETIDISTAYAKEVIGNVATGASRLSLGRNLSLLPFLILGLLKTVSIRNRHTCVYMYFVRSRKVKAANGFSNDFLYIYRIHLMKLVIFLLISVHDPQFYFVHCQWIYGWSSQHPSFTAFTVCHKM